MKSGKKIVLVVLILAGIYLVVNFIGKFSDSRPTAELVIETVGIETFLSDNGPKKEFGSSVHMYLDKENYILLDGPFHHYNNQNIEKVRYEIGEKTFEFDELGPIKIYSNTKGEFHVKRTIYPADGSDIEESGTKLTIYNRHPYIENDGITLGVLILVLALIFWTSSIKTTFWKRFYTILPALLLCYFVPAILNTMGIIDGENSRLYFVSSRFLLPASLVLLCLSVDLKGIVNLGPKALIMFGTATVGVIIGAPLALWCVSLVEPAVLGAEGPNAIWRGLSTISGSWIGGGANQTAMKEISETTDVQFSLMILVDVFIANIWMAFLLLGAGKTDKLDKILKADSSAITELKKKIENYQASIAKHVTFNDLIFMLAIAFGCTALGHLAADTLAPWIEGGINGVLKDNPDHWIIYISSFGKKFFWLILIATGLGVAFSFTKARKLEGSGASKVGSIFLYILVASIGMHIDFEKVILEWESIKYILFIGALWMLFHIIILLIVAKIIKAPFFFVAVGSQANIGGAASAPIVASAFSPALAPVGVLLAVLGYAIGTIGAIVCMELMHAVSM